MKLLVLSIAFIVALSSCYADIEIDQESIFINDLILKEFILQNHGKSFSLLLALLPLYGSFSIKRMINQYSIDKVQVTLFYNLNLNFAKALNLSYK